ncbi:MAG: type II CAAX prenyl endopeptidase Rce1 family protein [Bacteroidota bacterium]
MPAMLLAAALFAFAHGGNPNVSLFGFVNIGLASAWLSFAYLKVRNLWLPFGLHFGWNFSQTSIFGFPTSGISFEERKIMTLTQSGPEWLTGGAFGPEAGALATVALVACTWYIVRSKLLVAPEGIITLDSLEDLVVPELEGDAQS